MASVKTTRWGTFQENLVPSTIRHCHGALARCFADGARRSRRAHRHRALRRPCRGRRRPPGGDYLTTSNAAHEELLAFLAAHRDKYWTDTFVNIVRYVRAQRPERRR